MDKCLRQRGQYTDLKSFMDEVLPLFIFKCFYISFFSAVFRIMIKMCDNICLYVHVVGLSNTGIFPTLVL